MSAAHCGPHVDYVRVGEWRVNEESDDDGRDCVCAANDGSNCVCSEPLQVGLVFTNIVTIQVQFQSPSQKFKSKVDFTLKSKNKCLSSGHCS